MFMRSVIQGTVKSDTDAVLAQDEKSLLREELVCSEFGCVGNFKGDKTIKKFCTTYTSPTDWYKINFSKGTSLKLGLKIDLVSVGSIYFV